MHAVGALVDVTEAKVGLVLKELVADGTLSGILGVGGAGELLAEILPRLGGAGLEQDDRVTLVV